jgi:type I restriction enzyme S subunit
MRLEVLFDGFDQFADAPDALAKIRELLLHFAVHGLLVEQRPGDEPAAEMLETSRMEMSRLMDSGLAKRERTADPVSEDEASYRIPRGWTICRMVDLGQFINGLAFKPTDWGTKGRPIIRIQNLSGRNTIFNRTNASFDRSVLVQDGDILVSWSATLDAFIWRGEEAVLNQHIFRVLPAPSVHKEFLYWLLKWLIRQLAESDHAHGLVMSHINRGPFLAHPVLLPPLAEQSRIASKLAQLMVLCDQLETLERTREEKQGALARASLSRFADAPNLANLAFLFHGSFDISPADLRKSILTLAVRGKLVPQDIVDGPVEESVRAARKLAGLPIRALPDLAPNECLFETPERWRWLKLSDVAETRLGKMLDKQKNRGEAYRYLRNTNVHWFRFELDSIKTMPFESSELAEYRVERGDVLICEGGHGIARSAVWDGQIPDIMFQKALHRVRPLSCLNGHFLTFCLWVYERDGVLHSYYTGAGIPHFTGKALAKVSFPLPPVAEQRRIVAKVEQLMALVDELETQLAESRAKGANLLSAIVAELTAAA